jgi:hypothetical protein
MIPLPADFDADIEEIACPRGDRWDEFAAALNMLVRFAGGEGERERSLVRDQHRKRRYASAARQRRHRGKKAA